MSKNGEVGSAMAVQKKSRKRKLDSPLIVAAEGTSQDIKIQHQKRRAVGSKRKRSKAAGRNSSLEKEGKEDKMNEMKAFVQDMRTQMDFDSRLVMEAEARAEEFNAILSQLREESKWQLWKVLSNQFLADYLQSIILSLP